MIPKNYPYDDDGTISSLIQVKSNQNLYINKYHSVILHSRCFHLHFHPHHTKISREKRNAPSTMACFATRRITIVFIASSFLSFEAIAWQTGDALARRLVHRRAVSRRAPSCLAATVAKQEQADESSSSEDEDKIPTVRVAAVCGLDSLEMNLAAEIVQHSCHALGFGCDLDKALLLPAANASQKMLGPTGRIVVLQFPSQVEQDTLEALNEMIAARVDQDLYSDSPRLQDPFFLRFELNHDEEEDMPSSMSAIIEQAVQEGELRVPLDNQASDSSAMKSISFLPSQVVQVDGAWIQEPNNQNDDHARTWDTSSIHVFDGLVSPNLRKRLAQVIGGGKDLMGKHVPDPARWERGGLSDKLLDVCNNNDDDDTSSTASSSSSYGLTYEAIEEVCYRPHDAIQEMESIISNLFPDFIVTRLPEAVFGLAVSPLTANGKFHTG